MSSRNLAHIYVWHRARVDPSIIRVDPYRKSKKNRNWIFGAEVFESTRTWIWLTHTEKSSEVISGMAARVDSASFGSTHTGKVSELRFEIYMD